MLYIARREILPALISFATDLANSVNAVEAAGVDAVAQTKLLQQINEASAAISDAIDALAEVNAVSAAEGNIGKKAVAYRDAVIPAMVELRAISDGIEPVVGADYWPLPTYADMLFYR